MHLADAYEIATLFLFSSFLYRRINSAPFSMRHRNTTHPPPTTRGQKKALALYFMYGIRKKKWWFSTPSFFLTFSKHCSKAASVKVIHRLKRGQGRLEAYARSREHVAPLLPLGRAISERVSRTGSGVFMTAARGGSAIQDAPPQGTTLVSSMRFIGNRAPGTLPYSRTLFWVFDHAAQPCACLFAPQCPLSKTVPAAGMSDMKATAACLVPYY